MLTHGHLPPARPRPNASGAAAGEAAAGLGEGERGGAERPSAAKWGIDQTIWVWLKIKQGGQTAGFSLWFHLAGQPILEFRFFEPQPYVVEQDPGNRRWNQKHDTVFLFLREMKARSPSNWCPF